MRQLKLAGLIAAPFTPFKADGEVNYEAIPLQVETLVEQGVSGTEDIEITPF